MTQICIFNTHLFSLHNTLNYAIHGDCLRMVLVTDVYRNLTSLGIKPRERAFKQFKSPVLNVLISHLPDKVSRSSRTWQSHSMCKLFYLGRFNSSGMRHGVVGFVIPYVLKALTALFIRINSHSSWTVWPWRLRHYEPIKMLQDTPSNMVLHSRRIFATLPWGTQICFLFSAFGFLWIWFVEHPVGTFLLLRKCINFLWLSTVCCGGTQWHCVTSQKVAGSILGGVTGIFHWHNPSSCTMALGLTQPLT